MIIFSVGFMITSVFISGEKISSDADFGETHSGWFIEEIGGTSAFGAGKSFLKGNIFSIKITEVFRGNSSAVID